MERCCLNFFCHQIYNIHRCLNVRCYVYLTGNGERTCCEEHAEISLLSVHRWMFTHVCSHIRRILGLWVLSLVLFAQQRQRSSLGEGISQHFRLPANSHCVACILSYPLQICFIVSIITLRLSLCFLKVTLRLFNFLHL